VKDGQEEFGEVVAEIGWGDYGGMIFPPKNEWMISLVSDFFLSRIRDLNDCLQISRPAD
jgi:hypothetical protein